MLQTEQWMDIHLLFKHLGSIRAVVKQTGYSRNTVRKMLRATDGPPVFEKPARASGVDDFKEYLTKRFTEHGLSAERLTAEIRAQGFAGSVYMVRRFVKKLRPLRAGGSNGDAAIRDRAGLAGAVRLGVLRPAHRPGGPGCRCVRVRNGAGFQPGDVCQVHHVDEPGGR